jgi:hypothetical protein
MRASGDHMRTYVREKPEKGRFNTRRYKRPEP